ncbi:MAG TPA: hypothetical protein VGP15_17805, partial [Burkholderiales bacterium]|nr:hypothetical protein [Burkholderiales bacterium]
MDKLEAPIGFQTLPLDATVSRPGLDKITCLEDLHSVLSAKRAMPVIKLGDLLVELQLLTREQLDLVLCQKLGIPLIDLAKFTLDSRVLK